MELPGFWTLFSWGALLYAVALSVWNAFVEYGKAAGETGARESPETPLAEGASPASDGPPDGRPNEAVPSDRFTERLVSTGAERPYPEVARLTLTRLGLVGVVPGILVFGALTGGVIERVAWLSPVTSIGVGIALGVALYLLNAVLGLVLRRSGLWHGSDAYVSQLSPTGAREWAVHLGVVLPAVALVEEVWMRGVLVMVVNGATGIPFWALVPFSAVVFGMPHRQQGRSAVLLTALDGAVLGSALVVTESLLLVVVAHYVLNVVVFARVGLRPGG